METHDTKLQILDAAIDLFWKTSYHATNMNELSRAAGVNKATVYQHFGSKEELAVAAIVRAADRTVGNVFDGAFEAHDQPLDRLREIYRRIHALHVSTGKADGLLRGCPFINIGVELATTSDDVREAVQGAFERFAVYYRKIINDLRIDGSLTQNGTTKSLADDLQANMTASLVASKLEQDADAILRGSERAVRYLIA